MGIDRVWRSPRPWRLVTLGCLLAAVPLACGPQGRQFRPSQPSTAPPTASQPAISEQAVAKEAPPPGTQPAPREPAAREAVTGEQEFPPAVKPAVSQPTPSEPAAAGEEFPSAVKPAASEPAAAEEAPPAESQPVPSQPNPSEPVASEPAVAEEARPPATRPATSAPSSATQPGVIYDTTVARLIKPRDFFERWTLKRGADFRLVDKLMDPRTRVPEFDRQPLPPPSPEARISTDTPTLDDTDPFPPRAELGSQAVELTIGIARSTYRTREPQEVLAAAGPFLDLVQRDVATRGEPVLVETPQEIYYALLDGRVHMQISHVFDYLLVREWFQNAPDNGTILLCWAAPARPYTTSLDGDYPGPPGTGIVLVVTQEAPYQTPADLKGTRLSLAANFVDAPGAFLTRTLLDLGHPLGQPFFGRVTLRRYLKDALIDLLKGKADVACVDEGTLGTLIRFYGLGERVRVLAVSPHYNVDVIYSSVNNLATHRTEIELTQRELTTLAKDAEGEEILFMLDEAGWYNYREGDLDVARAHFADFMTFFQNTPADLKPLLDPNAPIDRRTYDRYGDE